MAINGSPAFWKGGSRACRIFRDAGESPLFPPETALHAVKIACERPDAIGRSLSLWDCQEIARQLVIDRVVESISGETVRRMMDSHRLKPWRKRMWLSSTVPRDARFAEQVGRIADLYARPLGPHERVLCADEQTSLQPRPRKAPTRPCRTGRPTQVEHEYGRCGALNLLGAFDTRSGHVWSVIAPRKRQIEFLDLLETIDADLPERVTAVYVILDNVSTHKGKLVQAWLRKHPRFLLVHPPVHCSWMNQIEQWFSIVSRKRLKISDFANKEQLKERLQAFIREWNERSHSFAWKEKSFEKILAKCERAIHPTGKAEPSPLTSDLLLAA